MNNFYFTCKECNQKVSPDELFSGVCVDCWAEFEEYNRNLEHEYELHNDDYSYEDPTFFKPDDYS